MDRIRRALSSIDLTPVPEVKDENNQFVVDDFIDHPVIPYPNTELTRTTFQLKTAWWSRLFR